MKTWKRFKKTQRGSVWWVVVVMIFGAIVGSWWVGVGGLIVGIATLWMLAVPCGIPFFNRNGWGHWVRQGYFLTMGLLHLVNATRYILHL